MLYCYQNIWLWMKTCGSFGELEDGHQAINRDWYHIVCTCVSMYILYIRQHISHQYDYTCINTVPPTYFARKKLQLYPSMAFQIKSIQRKPEDTCGHVGCRSFSQKENPFWKGLKYLQTPTSLISILLGTVFPSTIFTNSRPNKDVKHRLQLQMPTMNINNSSKLHWYSIHP